MRTCVGCRGRALAGELLRVVVVDGELVLDLRRRIGGRGAWLHPDPGCLTRAERRRAFPRALRVPGPLDVAGVRGQLEQRTHTTGSGASRAAKEERKQVDPS
ncbi:YlxR family protein [Actinophytocola sp.]|uniref:YlxR family protein n=1 Tax=Actinophytocola sp. TaxID=1872138 RepID=UPI0039C8A3D9